MSRNFFGVAILVASLSLAGTAQVRGTWASTGSMAIGRYAITAVLLQNGKVLVAGGVDSAGKVLASAELYDPSRAQWSSTGSMNFARNMYL